MKTKVSVIQILGRKGTTGEIKVVKIKLENGKTHIISVYGPIKVNEHILINTQLLKYGL